MGSKESSEKDFGVESPHGLLFCRFLMSDGLVVLVVAAETGGLDRCFLGHFSRRSLESSELFVLRKAKVDVAVG